MPDIPNELRDDLRQIFNEHDPAGILIIKEDQFDEYDPEISGIMVRFKRSDDLKVFTDEIHNVFRNMFSGLKFQKKVLDDLASDVYYLLKNELKDK